MFPAAAFAGMVLLASCSADELNSGGGSTIVPPSGETVSSGTVNFTNNTSMTIGNGSITEGTTRTAWMTRGKSFDFDGNEACKLEMPAQPAIPDDAWRITGTNNITISRDINQPYVVGEGKTATVTTSILSKDVYVESGGKVVVSSVCTGGGSIIVFEGGTLEYNANTLSGFNIYNYGGTVTLNGDLTIDSDAEFATTTDLDMQDNSLTVSGGKLYVGGDLTCSRLASETGGALIHVQGDFTAEANFNDVGNYPEDGSGQIEIASESDVCIEGVTNVYRLMASRAANVHTDCKLIAADVKETAINITNGATLCASYVEAGTLHVSGGGSGTTANVYLSDGGVMNISNQLSVGNAKILPYNSGKALVAANIIYIEDQKAWTDIFDPTLYINYETIDPESEKPEDTTLHNVAEIGTAGECSPGFTIDEPEETGEGDIVIKLPTGITEDYTLKADDFAIRVNGEYIEGIEVDGNTANLGDIQITDDNLTIKVSGLSYDNIIAGNDYTYEVWLWVYNRKLLNDGTGGYGPLFDTPEMYEEWVNPDNDLYKDPYTEGMINYDPYGCDFTSLLTDDKVYSPAGYVVRYNTYRGLSGHVDEDGYGDTPYIKVSIHVQRDDTAPEDTNVGVYPAIE